MIRLESHDYPRNLSELTFKEIICPWTSVRKSIFNGSKGTVVLPVIRRHRGAIKVSHRCCWSRCYVANDEITPTLDAIQVNLISCRLTWALESINWPQPADDAGKRCAFFHSNFFQLFPIFLSVPLLLSAHR